VLTKKYLHIVRSIFCVLSIRRFGKLPSSVNFDDNFTSCRSLLPSDVLDQIDNFLRVKNFAAAIPPVDVLDAWIEDFLRHPLDAPEKRPLVGQEDREAMAQFTFEASQHPSLHL
jgi:hypothetical protein